MRTLNFTIPPFTPGITGTGENTVFDPTGLGPITITITAALSPVARLILPISAAVLRR